jgi:DNA-binding SARP family transcriptional activator
MRIERGGVALELPQSNKTMALLAYLLWSPRPHRRTQLAAMLWCDADDPRGGLRWSLSKLRSLLDDDQRTRVSADREEVSIDASYLDVDVLAVRTAARAPSHGALEVLISVADGMKDGDLLDDIDLADCPDFHAWLVAAREEVRQGLVAILAELVRRLASDAPERAAHYARRWVHLEREDDRAHAALVRALAACRREREVEEHVRVHKVWLAERGRAPSVFLRQAWYEATGTAPHEPPFAPELPARAVPPRRRSDSARRPTACVSRTRRSAAARRW